MIDNIMTKVLHTISRISKGINHVSMVIVVEFLINIIGSMEKVEFIFSKIKLNK